MVDTPQGLRYRVYGGEVIDIEMAEPLEWGTRQEIQDLPFVKGKVRDLGQLHFQLVVEEAKTAIVDLITFFQNKNMEVAAVKEYLPPFDEIFVELFKEEERHV
jgi:hypothetical protein